MVSMIPEMDHFAYLRVVTELVCVQQGLSHQQTLRFIFAAEEVFGYCVKLYAQEPQALRPLLAALFFTEDNHLTLQLDYGKARGPLETYFRAGASFKRFARTTFEALGLYLARELVADIQFATSADGDSLFRISHPLPAAPRPAPS